MPIYTFKCPDCDFAEETIATIDERDTIKISCPKCCTFMIRAVDAPNIGKPAHQMGAILDNGKTVYGEFGKSARIR